MKRIVRIIIAGLALLAWPAAGRAAEPVSLPDPVLVVSGLEYYSVGGRDFTRYKFRVENHAAFPNELFAPSPELPPCGTNKAAARTWVDFYDESGKRLYGFCALGKPDDLNGIWFALPTETTPPGRVYIEINDRKTNTRYKSNLAPTSRDQRLK